MTNDGPLVIENGAGAPLLDLATTVRIQALTGLAEQAHFVRVDGGPVTFDLSTGSGVSLVSATTPALSKGISSWVVVP